MKKFLQLYEALQVNNTGPKLSWSEAKKYLKDRGIILSTYSNPTTRVIWSVHDSKEGRRSSLRKLLPFFRNRVNSKIEYIPPFPHSLEKIRLPYLTDYKPEVTPKYQYLQAKKTKIRLTPEQEKQLFKSPKKTYSYLIKVIKGRWPKAEPTFATDSKVFVAYVNRFIKDKWLEGEKYFLNHLKVVSPQDFLFEYEIEHLIPYLEKYRKGDRWLELEPYVKRNLSSFLNYVIAIGVRFPEIEKRILAYVSREDDWSLGKAIDYVVKNLKTRWKSFENIFIKKIDKDSYGLVNLGIEYADEVIKDRWPELETKILRFKRKDPEWKDVWKGYTRRILQKYGFGEQHLSSDIDVLTTLI